MKEISLLSSFGDQDLFFLKVASGELPIPTHQVRAPDSPLCPLPSPRHSSKNWVENGRSSTVEAQSSLPRARARARAKHTHHHTRASVCGFPLALTSPPSLLSSHSPLLNTLPLHALISGTHWTRFRPRNPSSSAALAPSTSSAAAALPRTTSACARSSVTMLCVAATRHVAASGLRKMKNGA